MFKHQLLIKWKIRDAIRSSIFFFKE